ncbi:MAG: DNA methyltransferase, partial [Acidilobaceae archaeon]
MEPAEAIESLAKPTKENKERVEEVREAIEGFARACSASPGYRRVAEELGRALERLYGSSPAEQEVIFAQSALALFLSALFYELERSRHDLKPLRELLEEKGLPEGFREAMRELGRRGYEMAEVAGELLAPLPPELAPILRKIVETAERSAGESSLLSHDLAGRIFHAIAGDIALRKGLATYYTETPAAYLLAWLAARELALTEAGGTTAAEALEAARRLSSARVADFACGSGTLLVAAHYALSQLSRLLCSPHQISCPEVEVDKIYGLDAQKYAAQIAAMNLSFLAGRPARHVYSVPFGYLPGKGALLGSLELLDESPALSAVREAPLARSHRIELELPGEFDIVIMNPPFTRATGRTKRRFAGSRRDFFGFLAELERRALTRRYNELQRKVREELSRIAEELFQRGQVSPPMLQGKGRRGYCDISRAGEGLPFLYLAYRYVKPGGVIAFVLPRNLLAGTSWFLARALLASKFHLKYVIVSSDGERGYNFSESTSLSECLVVARRVEEHSPEE